MNVGRVSKAGHIPHSAMVAEAERHGNHKGRRRLLDA
jgi:hypothetical protein